MNTLRLINKDLSYVRKEKIIKDENNVTSIEFLIPLKIDDITFFTVDDELNISTDCSFGVIYCVYSKENKPLVLNKSDLILSSDDISYFNNEKYIKLKWTVSSEVSSTIGSCVFCFVASRDNNQIFKSETQYFLINEDKFPANSIVTENNIIDTWSNHFERKLAAKQDTLTAGDNITIADNVISATIKGSDHDVVRTRLNNTNYQSLETLDSGFYEAEEDIYLFGATDKSDMKYLEKGALIDIFRTDEYYFLTVQTFGLTLFFAYQGEEYELNFPFTEDNWLTNTEEARHLNTYECVKTFKEKATLNWAKIESSANEEKYKDIRFVPCDETTKAGYQIRIGTSSGFNPYSIYDFEWRILLPASEKTDPFLTMPSWIYLNGRDCKDGVLTLKQGVTYSIVLRNYSPTETDKTENNSTEKVIYGHVVGLDRENSFADLADSPFTYVQDTEISFDDIINGDTKFYVAGDNVKITNLPVKDEDTGDISLETLELEAKYIFYPSHVMDSAIGSAAFNSVTFFLPDVSYKLGKDGVERTFLENLEAEEIYQKKEDLPYTVLTQNDNGTDIFSLDDGLYIAGEDIKLKRKINKSGTEEFEGVTLPIGTTFVKIEGFAYVLGIAFYTEDSTTKLVTEDYYVVGSDLDEINKSITSINETIEATQWSYKTDETSTTPIISFTDNFKVTAFGEITNLQITTSDTAYDPLYNAVVTFLSPKSSDTETVTPTELTYPSTLMTFLGDDCTDGVLVPQLDTGYEINVSWIYGKGLVARVGGFPR